jgi:hypothetical protein
MACLSTAVERCRNLFLAGVLVLVAASAQAQDAANRVISEQAATEAAARASQARIDNLDDETQRMLSDYRAALRETESLRRYNQQLESLVSSQTREIDGVGEQLARIESTNRDIYPHMQDMLETLERFVALDLPFLREERERRLDTLREIMNRADVSASEKYRRLIEAYGVEMEYGRTIEAYQGDQRMNGEQRTVEFLRVGRVSLLYQTLDGREAGYWDQGRGEWVRDDGYHAGIRDGLRIARRQAAPDLLILPVSAPEDVR